MSNDLNIKLNELVEALINSEEYKEFYAAKDEVEKDSELCRQINEYRRRNFDIQNNIREEELFEATINFDKEYENFRKEPRVAAFLSSELRVCRTIQEINSQVTEMIDLELNFEG